MLKELMAELIDSPIEEIEVLGTVLCYGNLMVELQCDWLRVLVTVTSDRIVATVHEDFVDPSYETCEFGTVLGDVYVGDAPGEANPLWEGLTGELYGIWANGGRRREDQATTTTE